MARRGAGRLTHGDTIGKGATASFSEDFLGVTNPSAGGVSPAGSVRYISVDSVPRVQELPMPPNDTPRTPAPRGKLMWFGVACLAVSAFMFVSIILKTALHGP